MSYNGSSGYKAVILNYEDHSFVRNVIDKPSMSYFSNNLDKIKDILSKTLIWGNFYGMIKDGELKSHDYFDLISKFIVQEESDGIFETQFDYLFNAINTYTPIKLRNELNDKVFNFVLNLLTDALIKLGENRLVVLKEKLVRFAQTNDTTKVVLSWLKGEYEQLKAH